TDQHATLVGDLDVAHDQTQDLLRALVTLTLVCDLDRVADVRGDVLQRADVQGLSRLFDGIVKGSIHRNDRGRHTAPPSHQLYARGPPGACRRTNAAPGRYG